MTTNSCDNEDITEMRRKVRCLIASVAEAQAAEKANDEFERETGERIRALTYVTNVNWIHAVGFVHELVHMEAFSIDDLAQAFDAANVFFHSDFSNQSARKPKLVAALTTAWSLLVWNEQFKNLKLSQVFTSASASTRHAEAVRSQFLRLHDP